MKWNIGRVALLAFALLGLGSGAARAEFDFDAKYAGDYISGQSSARLLALGGAGAAIATGPASVLGNAALMHHDPGQSLSLMHADRFESAVKVDYASYIRRTSESSAIGFGLVRRGVDDIPVTSLRDRSQPIDPQNRPYIANWTSASEYAFLLALSSERSWGSIGWSAKLLYKRLDTRDGFGLGMDLGYAKQWGGLIVGAQLRDAITSVIAWERGRQESIKPTLRAGTAYLLPWDRMNAVLMPVAEVEVRSEALGTKDAVAFRGGLEYTIRKIVSARIGIEQITYDQVELTYGAGASIGPVVLDYAFVGHEDLGATHRISLGYRWGASR